MLHVCHTKKYSCLSIVYTKVNGELQSEKDSSEKDMHMLDVGPLKTKHFQIIIILMSGYINLKI
jgi:hypothetical protein